MNQSKWITTRGWLKKEREFCVEQYYLNRESLAAAKRCYCEKFRDRNVLDRDKCPTSDQLRAWVLYEDKKRASRSLMQPQPEELRKSESVSYRSSLSTDTMYRPKSITRRGWSKAEREFCVEQYYLNRDSLDTVKRCYWEKFRDRYGLNRDKCPTSDQLRAWVIHEEKKRASSLMQPQPEELRKSESGKLSGTQWGRKTGENRIIRTESIDIGLHHQEIKWKQRDIKWRGPRPVNEKEKIVEPIVENPHYNYYYYQEPVEEEVKPDKKQVLQEKFEEKVLELIESLNAHGHAARASAFVSLRAELQRRALDGLLTAHRATLADHVSRALQRGKDGERKAAAAVAPLLAVQIGEEGSEEFVREVRPALAATATDKSASLDTRIECCSSLAVLCYLMEDDFSEILEVMRMYETIFSGSYLKDDGSVKVSGAAVEEGAWHAAALDGWALLLPLLSPNHALSLLNNQAPSFARLGEMLESVSLEVRMAAGEALVIAYEAVTDDDNSDNPLTEHVEVLIPRLTELSRDWHRFRAKRDRKIQRATFRDILKYFEEGEEPCISAHIGSESAVWSHWSGGAAYAALAGALGGALQVLAPRCPRLRAALALADLPPTEMALQGKPNKLQRHLQNRAACKARNLTRNKNRDKRSAVLVI